MSRLEREIRAQPEALARLLADADGQIADLARVLAARGLGSVTIAARGSSDNAARYAQYLLGERLGLPVALAAPSLESLHAAGAVPRGAHDLVIGISQSGRSPDVVAVLDAARDAGTATVAITNDSASPLALAAEHILALGVGEERSVAATMTYTASLAVLAALTAELRDGAADRAAVRRLPEQVAAAIDAAFAGGDVPAAAHVVVVGRGYNLATAMEIALKVRELSGTVAEGFSAADLMHGPIAAVGPDTLAVAVAPPGVARASVLAAADALRERGARVLELVLSPDVPEWLSPVTAVVPGQVLALRLAALAGRDPDAPAGLVKVTETR